MENKKQNFFNKKNITITLIILFIIVGIFALKKNNEEIQNTYTVTTDTVSDELIFAGIIDAEKRVDLGFAVGGRVTKNNAIEGSYVKKGDVLAELDQSSIRAGLVQANANYQLTKIDTTTNADNSNLSYEELVKEQNTIVENLRQQYISGDLKAYLVGENDLMYSLVSPVISGTYNGENKGAYLLDVYKSAANSGYSYTYSGLEEGRNTAEIYQAQKLGDKGLYIQFDANTRYHDTQWEIPVPNTRSATYLTRKTAYENALVQRDKILADAKNNLNKLVKKDTSSNISYSDARINNAQAQINANIIRLSDGKIVAPFDAYVIKNNLELGETVQALIPQITLFATQKKKLVLNTPEIYINKIYEGDKVEISLDAYPDILFTGYISKIDTIDTLVDGVPVYQTEVMFDTEDDRLRVGMNAHAKIIATEKSDVLAIPKHFIQKKDNNNIVFVVSNSGIKEQIIETGIEGNNGLVEVLSGLSVGDIISNKNN